VLIPELPRRVASSSAIFSQVVPFENDLFCDETEVVLLSIFPTKQGFHVWFEPHAWIPDHKEFTKIFTNNLLERTAVPE